MNMNLGAPALNVEELNNMKWLTSEDAKRIPEGSVVLIRNNTERNGKKYVYEVRQWFRPDWVGLSDYEPYGTAEYLLVEKYKQDA